MRRAGKLSTLNRLWSVSAFAVSNPRIGCYALLLTISQFDLIRNVQSELGNIRTLPQHSVGQAAEPSFAL